jgi:hypothetical protein
MNMTGLDEVPLFGSMDEPYGVTYGAWTNKWWKWINPIPKEKSPLRDDTGELWDIKQPSSDVWFLVGNFAREYKTPIRNFPNRKIKRMPAGRSILLPVLNCMATQLEYENLHTHDDLIRHVENDVNSVVKREFFIDNKRYKAVRIPSNPRIFKVEIHERNAFEIKNSGVTDAAADGYWAFIKPLSKGHHTIRIEGSCENGRLSAGASYELDMV